MCWRAVFAIQDDDDSNDSLEDSIDEASNDITQMCTDDSSDVDVLYQLSVDPENFESSEESNSDESETEWPKQEINATDVDFDKIHVAPR